MTGPVPHPTGDDAQAPVPGPLRRRMPPRARRILLWAGLALLLVVVAIAAAEGAGWPFLRGPLQRQMQERMNVPVRIDAPFRLKLLWNPGLQLGHVQVGAPAGLGVTQLLDAQDLQLRWRWSELLNPAEGQPRVLRELSARQLQANLVRLADGRATWPVMKTDAPSPPGAGLPITIGRLQLQEGEIVYRDALTETDVVVQLQGEQGAAGTSHINAQARGTWQQRPLRLRASTAGTTGLVEDGEMVPVNLHGVIGQTELSFRGAAADLGSGRALRGSLLVRGSSLADVGDTLGVTLPTTPPFRLATALTHDAGLWNMVTTQARVGGSRLQADLRFDTRPQPGRDRPLLTGRLGGEILRLKDLGPAIGTAAPSDVAALPSVLDEADRDIRPAAGAGQARQAPRAGGRVLPDRKFDLRALNRMDADVQVAIATFDLGDDAKVAPLRDLYTHLTLRDGKLDLAELRAQVAGGQVTGQSSLTTQPASAVAQWRADLRFAGMQLEQWLRALQREGRPVASGRLTARMQVQGKGSSTAGILATLQGQAGAAIRQGTVSHLLVELAGLDVAQALGVYVRGDAPLPLNCAVMQAEIQDGLLRTREAFLDTRDSSVRINGQINLADESLALRAELKPKDFSPFSLRTPLVVTGTLGAPQVGVDQRRLLTRVAAALALGAAAGPAALLPFIELGSDKGEDAQPCAAPR